MTSSPPSSGLTPAVRVSASLNAGNTRRGLRSLRNLTCNTSRHELTATAMHHLYPGSSRPPDSPASPICQALVRFFALLRLLVLPRCLAAGPVNSFEFSLAAVLPRRDAMRWLRHGGPIPPPSVHRLRLGLPGYLIMFAPQLSRLSVDAGPGGCLRPSVFFPISAHFTATPGIPPPPATSEASSSGALPGLSPRFDAAA